jgi:hypothetical protein
MRYSFAHSWWGGGVKHRWVLLAVLLLSSLVTYPIGAEVRRVPVSINGRIPLGIESFRLEPSNNEFYLIASAEQRDFVGLQRVTDGDKDRLVLRNGKQMTFYPEQVQFRLTASARERLVEEHPFPTKSSVSLPDFFIKLRFRLKVFHGLEYRYVQPSYVDDIGMPRDVPYDERIYRIGFNVGKVPIEDRVVMEVLSPTGERLCKFHLDLL